MLRDFSGVLAEGTRIHYFKKNKIKFQHSSKALTLAMVEQNQSSRKLQTMLCVGFNGDIFFWLQDLKNRD